MNASPPSSRHGFGPATVDAMTALVTRWAEIPSGSHDPAGLDRMRAALVADFAGLPAVVEELPLPVPPGEFPRAALRWRCRPEAPVQTLLVGHYDTVFGPDHPFRAVTRDDDDHGGETGRRRLRGPGVADMKGGLAVMLHALRAFEALPDGSARRGLGWEVLLVPDEELGSPFSRGVLTKAAGRHHLGLVFEPALPDGGLASARKGSGNFHAVVHGRAAHAGRDLSAGRNAVVALAGFLVAADALNGEGRDGVTVNVGAIEGGGPANIVPDRARATLNVRTVRAEDEPWVRDRLAALAAGVNAREGFRLELDGEFTSPPKPATPATDAMLRDLAACAAELGHGPLTWAPTGGTCDGNRLAAAGLPNVDNLGPRGGGLHSADEFIEASSLPERAALVARYLGKLAAGTVVPPSPL